MSLALLHRLHSLAARVTDWHLRWLKRVGLTIVLLLTLAALGWQLWLLPRLNEYKPWLERQISAAIGAPVKVGQLQGGWQGVRPSLALLQFQVLNTQQQTVLEFTRMEGALTWWHLLLGEIRFSRLVLQAPQVDITRLKSGQWQIAGMTLASQGHGGGAAINWLLKQGELSIERGQLRLHDERNVFPALSASDLQLTASNWLGRHKLVLRFTPVQLAGQSVEINAKLDGDDVNRWVQWSGWVKLDLPQTDLARAAPWLSPWMPDLKIVSGLGRMAVKLEIDAGRIEGVDAELGLSQWQLRLADTNDINLPRFDGRIQWRDRNAQRSLQISGREINGEQGAICRDCTLEYTEAKTGKTLSARGWQLDGLGRYFALLPDQLAAYRGAKIRGQLSNLELQWQGAWPKSENLRQQLSGELDIEQAGISGVADLPTVSGLDLALQFEPRGGRLTLAGKNTHLSYPEQFLEPLNFSLLKGQLAWQRADQGWLITLDGLKLANPELSLSAQASYRWPGKGMGQVDLSGQIEQLAANRVYAYLPRVLGDDVLYWLKSGLTAGQARQGKIIWRGDVDHFPYTKGTAQANHGQFYIQTQGVGVTVNYGDDWPVLTQIFGDVTIDGMQLTVDASKAVTSGTNLHHIKVIIPNLEHNQHVLVDGKAQGKTSDFLGFVRNSPVRLATHGFLDQLTAQGNADLDLRLDIPIDDVDKTKVTGKLAFGDNQLNFGESIPQLNEARGAVSFTESTLTIAPSHAKVLGGAVQLSGNTDAKGALNLTLQGTAQINAALGKYAPVLSKNMQGLVPFQASLGFNDEQYELNLASQLQGARIDLPAPLNKPQGAARAFRLKVGNRSGESRVDFVYDKWLQAAVVLGKDAVRGKLLLGGNALQVSPDKALTAILPVMDVPAKGLQISGRWPQLKLEEWLAVRDLAASGAPQKMPSIVLSQLEFEQLNGWGRLLNDVKLNGQLSDQGAQMNVSSAQIGGDLQWSTAQNRLNAQLNKLWLPLKRVDAEAKPNLNMLGGRDTHTTPIIMSEGPDVYRQWPALNLNAKDFRFNDLELGALHIQSKPQALGIDFEELSVANADGQFVLTGSWLKREGAERTQAQVKVDSPNMGKLLKRLGYPEAMLGAPLQFKGEGRWVGAPWQPQWPTLQGQASLDVGAGQFVKLDPGVGRFLSVLSLQALPRRLKLDFSDVFSGGFEFDQIRGDAVIENGIAKTDNLLLNGPAAKIRFTGDANFIAGTQHLRVRIVPSVSGAVALGVTVLNPIAGLATLAVQSVMDNPLGELVAFEYQIDGSMSDPQIKKLGVKSELPRRN